jgi:hypothetical protein
VPPSAAAALRAKLTVLRADALAQLAAGRPVIDTGLLRLAPDARTVLAAIDTAVVDATPKAARAVVSDDNVRITLSLYCERNIRIRRRCGDWRALADHAVSYGSRPRPRDRLRWTELGHTRRRNRLTVLSLLGLPIRYSSSGALTVCEQNWLLSVCFGLSEVNKA